MRATPRLKARHAVTYSPWIPTAGADRPAASSTSSRAAHPVGHDGRHDGRHDGPGLPRRRLLGLGAALGTGLLAAPGLAACGSAGSSPGAAAATGTPKRGGVLHHGTTGGSAKDTLDPHNPVTYPDQARVCSLYEPLFRRDPNFVIQPLLAESIEPSTDATTWTLTLRKGVTFHNGKTLTADDVIASIKRIIDPKNPGAGASDLAMIDPAGLKRIDDTHLQIGLKHPYALLEDQLAQYALGIVPADFDLAKPVGTGPLAYQSFSPGQQSTFTRYDGYWGPAAHVDQLVIVDFVDDAAKVNALLSGQVQSVDNLPVSQIEAVKAAGVHVLISESGSWTPFTMRVDTAPFSDVRVRQALRLVVDREQMVAQALNGQGRIGNDLYAPFDPAYAKDLPQRHQDLEQAKSLLASAGHAGMTIELVTSTAVGSGAVESAQLLAQQAKGAGLNVTIRNTDSTTFYGSQYLSWPFAQDFWFTRSYLPQIANGSTPSSPYNECHWADKTFLSLVAQAQRELDATKRAAILHDCQKIEYESGGYIVWGFKNQVDAYSPKVSGFVPDKNLPMSSFQFSRAWFG
jgi:peptide/nickel transport system substrate-binding protein